MSGFISSPHFHRVTGRALPASHESYGRVLSGKGIQLGPYCANVIECAHRVVPGQRTLPGSVKHVSVCIVPIAETLYMESGIPASEIFRIPHQLQNRRALSLLPPLAFLEALASYEGEIPRGRIYAAMSPISLTGHGAARYVFALDRAKDMTALEVVDSLHGDEKALTRNHCLPQSRAEGSPVNWLMNSSWMFVYGSR